MRWRSGKLLIPGLQNLLRLLFVLLGGLSVPQGHVTLVLPAVPEVLALIQDLSGPLYRLLVPLLESVDRSVNRLDMRWVHVHVMPGMRTPGLHEPVRPDHEIQDDEQDDHESGYSDFAGGPLGGGGGGNSGCW